MIVLTRRGRFLSEEVNFILFQPGTTSWNEHSVDVLGFILIMNVIYCLESVADSSIQWGAVGEYFSPEAAIMKKFQSDLS